MCWRAVKQKSNQNLTEETYNKLPEWQKLYVDIKKFDPKGFSAPVLGLYTCIKTWKSTYKIRLQRDFFLKLATNGQSDKAFLLTSKFCPEGLVCPCPAAIYMYKIIKKNVYKIRLQRDFFLNLQQMGKVIRPFCWHQHFVSRGCVPLPWGYIHVLNHKKRDLPGTGTECWE